MINFWKICSLNDWNKLLKISNQILCWFLHKTYRFNQTFYLFGVSLSHLKFFKIIFISFCQKNMFNFLWKIIKFALLWQCILNFFINIITHSLKLIFQNRFKKFSLLQNPPFNICNFLSYLRSRFFFNSFNLLLKNN